MTVEIERLIYRDEDAIAIGPLNRQVWTLSLDWPYGSGSLRIRLVSYREQYRESKRHKWKNCGAGTCYNLYDNRRRWEGYGRSADTVPWDNDLLAEVATKVADSIRNAKVEIE